MMQRRSGGCWNAFGRIPKHSNVSKNADSEIFGGKAEHIPSLFFSIKAFSGRKQKERHFGMTQTIQELRAK